MLLKSIKLVGFKSFVDPTIVPIRNRLNAIVGPNGCGKSNVVDGIRWVVGEMSAKQLRGQSMSDVIFNGTKNRPSVGRASIELLFDNQSGRLGGPYAAYHEFSIRREIIREGSSNYFINGTVCRRRDIVDVFLGTGLGSQTYAIIEQGMIARLVEAKPDELRTYIEEAAGISKYKDRRRETETRMKQTQGNLERLNDLLDELIKQQRHLKRQSNAAERYKTLKDEERHLTAQINAVKWQMLDQQLQQTKENLRVQVTCSDQNTAAQRALETRLEKERLSCNDAQHCLNQVQQKYYEINTTIARFEEQINHIEQQKARWTAELDQIRTLKANLLHQMGLQQTQIQALTQQVSHAEPTLLEKKRQADHAKQQLEGKEIQMETFQKEQETFRSEFQAILREKDITQTQLTHYKGRIRQLEEKLINLQTQEVHEALKTLQNTEKPLEESIEAMQKKLEQINQELSAVNSDLQAKKSRKAELAKNRQGDEKTLYEKKRQLAVLEGLQAAAFGHHNETVKSWLEKHQLMQYQRLAQCIQVDSRWEKAAEIVLEDFFDALCVQSIASYHDLLHAFPEGRLTLIEKSEASESSDVLPYDTLNTKIKANGLIEGMLKHIYLAKDLSTAYEIRAQLKHGQSVITQEGIWLGKNWVRLFKAAAQKENILSREKKLKQLAAEVFELEKIMEKNTTDFSENDATILALESQRDKCNIAQRDMHTRLATIKAKLSEQKLRLSELERQQMRWIQEKEDNEKELTALKEKSDQASMQLSTLEVRYVEYSQRKSILESTKNELDQDLSHLRESAVLMNRELDAVALRLEGQRNELNVLNQSTVQAEQQVSHLSKKQAELEANLSADDSPMEGVKNKLQLTLQERVSVESSLAEVRDQFETHEKNMGELQTELQKVLNKVNHTQSEMQEIRMMIQRMTLEQVHLVEQIQKVNHDIKEICQTLPEDVSEEILQEAFEKNQQRIARLGPINLAAIHEHEEVSKRRDYLEKQKDDLLKALTILKEAISKVDKETRERFKKTFDAVNENLATLFPRIFEGGHAELQLTEDDLLVAGVTIRAQPPGKRNASIHLLSGGEKTLTAISLVFALFELNPAPFCILDEVDAPLDDINVGRFCQLLKEMADKTQFLIITHNKVTMEMADALMGVTMQEAGVSRVVSVTMEDAIKYAESSGREAQDV